MLGDAAENAFRQSMLMSQGDMSIFFAKRLVGFITTLALLLLFWPMISWAGSEVRRTSTANHWGEGGKGAADLAKIVVSLCEKPSKPTFVYEDADPLWEKIDKIAKKVYRAGERHRGRQGQGADPEAAGRRLRALPGVRGEDPVVVLHRRRTARRASDHVVNVREVRLAAGAEFVVMICGDIMTMPGLPKVPSAEKIDLVDGKVVGLF